MTTYLDTRHTQFAARQTAASHLIVVELRPGQDLDLAGSIDRFIDSMALTPGCARYTVQPHPVACRTWLIDGDWEHCAAMHEHFQSSALQALISHLRSLQLYRLAFSCQVSAALTPPNPSLT